MGDIRSIRPVWAELDLDALAANPHVIRERAGPDKKVIASIKADAYGHALYGLAAVQESLHTGSQLRPVLRAIKTLLSSSRWSAGR